MRIAFSFFGMTGGNKPPTSISPINTEKDVRHCWPCMKKMLIDPFVEQGHEAKIYFSTYPTTNEDITNYIKNEIRPEIIQYSEVEGSNPFTTKDAAFQYLLDLPDTDVIVWCRNDMHFSKVIAHDNIDFDKFNFLFRVHEPWWSTYRFMCDNFYMWPHRMTPDVHKAILDTYGFPRGEPNVDTHALLLKLVNYIPIEEVHLISDEIGRCDVNTFYTLCREELARDHYHYPLIHPEVKERFDY